MSTDLHAKNRNLFLIVMAIVVFMVSLSFAAVPLYDLFCRVTGFGGATQISQQLPDKIIDREVSVFFNADTSQNLPWNFKPEARKIDVKLGQKGFISYIAHNSSNKPVTGTAVYNVVPAKAGKYFHKIQCFCFGEQLLEPNQTVDMPVMFYVDPAMDDDPNMDDVGSITLSYTFFKAETEELDNALEAYYNVE